MGFVPLALNHQLTVAPGTPPVISFWTWLSSAVTSATLTKGGIAEKQISMGVEGGLAVGTGLAVMTKLTVGLQDEAGSKR